MHKVWNLHCVVKIWGFRSVGSGFEALISGCGLSQRTKVECLTKQVVNRSKGPRESLRKKEQTAQEELGHLRTRGKPIETREFENKEETARKRLEIFERD